MGADLDLLLNGEFCRVPDVSGESFVVRAKGGDRPITRGNAIEGTTELRLGDIRI